MLNHLDIKACVRSCISWTAFGMIQFSVVKFVKDPLLKSNET